MRVYIIIYIFISIHVHNMFINDHTQQHYNQFIGCLLLETFISHTDCSLFLLGLFHIIGPFAVGR